MDIQNLRTNWQNLQIGSMACGVRAIIEGKAKWKPPELSLPMKIVKKKQYCIPGGIAEVTVTIDDLKGAGVLISTTFPFISPIWPMQKTDGSIKSGFCFLIPLQICSTFVKIL